MKTRTALMTVLSAGALVLATATPSHAAVVDYFKNHPDSKSCTNNVCPVNISISTTNPPSAGHIFSVKPGYAGTGACVYASAAYLTMIWWGNGHAYALKAGAWNCFSQRQDQATVRVVP